MFVGKLGTFVALGVWGSGMIENRRFNLVEFYDSVLMLYLSGIILGDLTWLSFMLKWGK